MAGKLHTILSIVDALVVFTIQLNTLSKAHLMTISAFDIACWVSAGNLLKSFDDTVLHMYFSCTRYEVRKKESVDLEIRGVFFFKTPPIQENTPFLSQ